MGDTRPDKDTREAERQEASTEGKADRPPTEDEERAAEKHGPLDEQVVASEKEMAERGVNQQGEGKID